MHPQRRKVALILPTVRAKQMDTSCVGRLFWEISHTGALSPLSLLHHPSSLHPSFKPISLQSSIDKFTSSSSGLDTCLAANSMTEDGISFADNDSLEAAFTIIESKPPNFTANEEGYR
jgi:hypothetical protein